MKTKIIKEIINDIKNIVKIRDKKKFLIENLPYLLFFYIGNILSKHINSYIGGDVIDRIIMAISDITTISVKPSIVFEDVVGGLALALVIKLILF